MEVAGAVLDQSKDSKEDLLGEGGGHGYLQFVWGHCQLFLFKGSGSPQEPSLRIPASHVVQRERTEAKWWLVLELVLSFADFPMGFPGGSEMVKNLPTMQETWVQSLGREDPLEKGMAPHFSILA